MMSRIGIIAQGGFNNFSQTFSTATTAAGLTVPVPAGANYVDIKAYGMGGWSSGGDAYSASGGAYQAETNYPLSGISDLWYNIGSGGSPRTHTTIRESGSSGTIICQATAGHEADTFAPAFADTADNIGSGSSRRGGDGYTAATGGGGGGAGGATFIGGDGDVSTGGIAGDNNAGAGGNFNSSGHSFGGGAGGGRSTSGTRNGGTGGIILTWKSEAT